MRKKCMIYLESSPFNEIKPLLDEFDVEIIHVADKNEFTQQNHDDKENTAFIIYEGDSRTYQYCIEEEFENAFIIWIHSDSKANQLANNITKAFKSFNEALVFLHNLSEKPNNTPEFIKRVPLLSNKKELPHNNKVEKTQTEVKKNENINVQKNKKNQSVQNNISYHSRIWELKKQESEKKNILQDKLLHQRSKQIQNLLFVNKKWERNKTVGVWSPVHKTGVTTITLSFAFFLACHRYDTVVLEGLTENFALKEWLQLYTKKPPLWVSYAKSFYNNEITDKSKWSFRDVLFLPLDYDDTKMEWNEQTIKAYITTPNIVDVTLVDFPTGTMADQTLQSLHHIDELWIIINERYYQETLAWGEYIHNLKSTFNCPIHFVFNEVEQDSQAKQLSKQLGFPFLTSLPILCRSPKKTKNEIPMYFNEKNTLKLNPAFLEIAKHLFKNNFNTEKKQVKQNKWFNLLKPLNLITGNDRMKV